MLFAHPCRIDRHPGHHWAKFIRQAGSRFFIEEDWAKLENLFSALPSPIEIGGSYQLYPLPKDNP